VNLFGESTSRLTSIGGFVSADCVGDWTVGPKLLDKIKNAVLIDSIANSF
jgi:hypothetical protein